MKREKITKDVYKRQVKTRDFKFNTAKTAKYNLRKEGIEIKLTERGMIDEYKVCLLYTSRCV